MTDVLADVKDCRSYTVRCAAEFCGTTDNNVRKNIHLGKLPAHKVDGRVYVKGSDLKVWYNSHKWYGRNKEQKPASEPVRKPVPGYKHDCRFFSQPGEGVVVCTALTAFYNGKAAAEKCRGCCFYKARKGVAEEK